MTQPTDLSDPAKFELYNQVTSLLDSGSIGLDSFHKTVSGWTVTFRPQDRTERSYDRSQTKFNVYYHKVHHSDPEPHPSVYGDTEEVTRAAVAHWHPGQTNEWDEHVLTVEVDGLQGFSGTLQVRCEFYDANIGSSNLDSIKNLAAKIMQQIESITAAQTQSQKDRQEQTQAAAIRDAFSAF